MLPFLKIVDKVFTHILDFIFPRDQRELEIEKLTKENLVELKLDRNFYLLKGRKIHFLFGYRNKAIRKIIEMLKYKKNIRVSKICADILYKEIISNLDLNKKYLLIPIPQSSKRRMEKGFNQTEILCKFLYEKNKNLFDYDPKVLIRFRHTVSQTKLKRTERLENIKDSMKVVLPEKTMGREIILIDDVFTTGATLLEAEEKLLNSKPSKIHLFVLAH